MKTTSIVLSMFVIASCSPKQLETLPVEVKTKDGIVICQLYTTDFDDWDRAISRPNRMSVEDADEVCKSKGRKIAST